MIDFVSALGPGETLAFMIVLGISAVLAYRYAMASLDAESAALSTQELRQIVRAAVNDATEPLEARIDVLERRQEELKAQVSPRRLDASGTTDDAPALQESAAPETATNA
jgi:hypothetical protein